MIRVCVYTGQKADFYLQSHGKNAGRPLKKPLRNSFAVYTNIPGAFALINCLFLSGKFRYYITGSVIPFVRIHEIRGFLKDFFSKDYDLTELETVEKIENLIQVEKHKIVNLKQLQLAIIEKII